MTPQERKVFELALEALEREARGYAVHDELQIPRSMRDAIVAIKEVLALPEKPWVSLTDEKINQFIDHYWADDNVLMRDLIRMVEQEVRELQCLKTS